ncbi:MAG: SLBB domain-containing protein [Cyanobacteria bacterium J06573_11]
MVSKLKLNYILSAGAGLFLAAIALYTAPPAAANEAINNTSIDSASPASLPRIPNPGERLESLQAPLDTSQNGTPDRTLDRTPNNTTAPAARSRTNTSAISQLDNAYTLGPGDVIQVEIFNVPEYSGNQQVLADGSINLEAISPVNIGGLTPQEAEQAISVAYRSELRYPQITVILEEPRPLRVAIAGEVGEPGLYSLTPDGNAQFPTVSQAIQTAGGVTQAADLYNVQLRRSNGRRPAQTVNLNLWDLLNNGDLRQDLALRDGDAIVISETRTVDLAESNRLSASNLAASAEEDIVIAVVGEVFRPGAYEFEGSNREGRTTITQAIQTAGGIQSSADIQQIQVRRLTRGGSEQLIDIDFWKLLQEGDLTQDLVLQQGDTVIIPEATEITPTEQAQLAAANFSPEGVQVNVVGEVASPGQLQVSPNTTLNQAVLAAGGFTDRSTEIVELIRLNPNGSVTQQQIEVNLAEGVNPERNPLILNNDVVLVGRNARARFGDSVSGLLRPVLQILSPLRFLF